MKIQTRAKTLSDGYTERLNPQRLVTGSKNRSRSVGKPKSDTRLDGDAGPLETRDAQRVTEFSLLEAVCLTAAPGGC